MNTKVEGDILHAVEEAEVAIRLAIAIEAAAIVRSEQEIKKVTELKQLIFHQKQETISHLIL